MKKTKAKILMMSVLFIVLLCSCTSTRAVEVVKTEFLPIKLDIQDSVDYLYDTRPQLEPVLDDEPSNLAVVLVAYKDFGEAWMNYSFRLEDYINNLVEALKPEE